MNGSSCPTCGWVLRWLPEQSAWGCDRCRKVVAAGAPPAQPQPPQMQPPMQPPPGSPYAPPGAGVAQPAPYAPPMQYGHQPPPPGYGPPMGAVGRGGKSSKGLLIGIAVAAVAAAGIIIAVVVAKGGGGGGAGSRDSVVEGTLAALAAGDVDKLVKLGDPMAMQDKAVDCSERDKAKKPKDKDGDEDKDADKDKDSGDDDADDPEIQAKRARRQYERLVETTKGTKYELVSVSDAKRENAGGDDDKDEADKGKRISTMKKGDKAGTGCVFKTDVRIHQLRAKVKVTEADAQPAEQEAEMTVLEIDGSWYLGTPPTFRASAGGLEANLKKFRDQMCACKDTACADAVKKDSKDWMRANRDAAKKLDKADRKVLDEIDDEMKACRDKIGGGNEVREALVKMTEFKMRMCACADKPCADKVSSDMTSWSMSVKDQKGVPSSAETKMLGDLAGEIGSCAVKAMTPTDDPPPPEPEKPDTVDTGGGTGTQMTVGGLTSIPSCADYKRQIVKIRSCPKYPASSADAMKQGFEQLEKSWGALANNAAAREQMAKSCTAGAGALRQAIDAMCP